MNTTQNLVAARSSGCVLSSIRVRHPRRTLFFFLRFVCWSRVMMNPTGHAPRKHGTASSNANPGPSVGCSHNLVPGQSSGETARSRPVQQLWPMGEGQVSESGGRLCMDRPPAGPRRGLSSASGSIFHVAWAGCGPPFALVPRGPIP